MVIYKSNIPVETAADRFAALGSGSRLQVVLALVRAGTNGLSVGDIQWRTGIAASTLAHHLRFLVAAGLVRQEKSGRSVMNFAAFDTLEALAGYILNECCLDEMRDNGDNGDKNE